MTLPLRDFRRDPREGRTNSVLVLLFDESMFLWHFKQLSPLLFILNTRFCFLMLKSKGMRSRDYPIYLLNFFIFFDCLYIILFLTLPISRILYGRSKKMHFSWEM